MDLIRRTEAKAQGLKRYLTGKPCKHGHISERFTYNSLCCECLSAYRKTPEAKATNNAYWQSDVGKQARKRYDSKPERKAKQMLNDKKPHRAAKKLAYQRTPARKAYQAKINKTPKYAAARKRIKQLPHSKARAAEYRAEYAKTNPHILAALNAKRRALKLKATPAWADHQAIKKIYDDCAFVSRVTGQAHHVDHVIPLRGKTVCGLHVAANLQILTASENVKKSNKLLDDHFLQ